MFAAVLICYLNYII